MKESYKEIKSPIWLKEATKSSCATPYENESEKHCYELFDKMPNSLIPHTSTNCKSHCYPPLNYQRYSRWKDLFQYIPKECSDHFVKVKVKVPIFQLGITMVTFFSHAERIWHFGIHLSMSNLWEYWNSTDNNYKNHPLQKRRRPLPHPWENDRKSCVLENMKSQHNLDITVCNNIVCSSQPLQLWQVRKFWFISWAEPD